MYKQIICAVIAIICFVEPILLATFTAIILGVATSVHLFHKTKSLWLLSLALSYFGMFYPLEQLPPVVCPLLPPITLVFILSCLDYAETTLTESYVTLVSRHDTQQITPSPSDSEKTVSDSSDSEYAPNNRTELLGKCSFCFKIKNLRRHVCALKPNCLETKLECPNCKLTDLLPFHKCKMDPNLVSNDSTANAFKGDRKLDQWLSTNVPIWVTPRRMTVVKSFLQSKKAQIKIALYLGLELPKIRNGAKPSQHTLSTLIEEQLQLDETLFEQFCYYLNLELQSYHNVPDSQIPSPCTTFRSTELAALN